MFATWGAVLDRTHRENNRVRSLRPEEKSVTLKSHLKHWIYQTIVASRLPRLLHRTTFPNALVILTYHGVTRTPLEVYNWCFLDELSFRFQIRYLKTHFSVIDLSEAVQQMENGTIDRPTAVITFDDGFQNNYNIAYPILRKAGLPATIFLTTGLVNTEDTVWSCRLARALIRTSRSSFDWNANSFDLSGPNQKAKALRAIQAKLKHFPQPKLLEEIRRISLELGEDPNSPIKDNSPFRMLSHEAITEMAASGLIEFGAHTHSHAILSRLSREEQFSEIKRSLDAIHELSGRPCRFFAYPNGLSQDYDAQSIARLEECGVRASVTAIAGPNGRTTPNMELRRYSVGAGGNMALFQLQTHHLVWCVKNWKSLYIRGLS